MKTRGRNEERQGAEKGKVVGNLTAIFFCAVWIYVILNSVLLNGNHLEYQFQQILLQSAERMYLPGAVYVRRDTPKTVPEWLKEQAMFWIPFVGYVDAHKNYEGYVEDEETIAKILASQAEDGHALDVNGNPKGDIAPIENVVPQTGTPTLDMSIERLRDFDYLLSNFYIVDSTTMIGADQLNPDDLLNRSMKINLEGGGPKVLIFHTHSQETFVDSVEGDASTSIVGIGEYLTQLLNAKGIETIHDTGIYDIINGQLDRSSAYENAEASIRPVLEANPTIEVVIDLHRDGVAEETHLVTDIGGKPTAKIMYFNGLSRTRVNGDIDYLYNPYIQDNLAFSLQMQIASETLYPGFVRPIYLRGYRYNLHLMPKSLLIEAGAQTNTVGEMRNAMEVLAETLHHVLIGD